MLRRALLLLVTLDLTGCGPSEIQTYRGDSTDPGRADDPSNPPGGPAEPPPPSVCETSPQDWIDHWCEFDADCCSGQKCVAATCALPPGACTNNDDCPAGFLCAGNVCVDCVTEADCGPNAACVDGACVPEECATGTPDLEGTWQLRSRLNTSEATWGFVLDFGDAAAEACDWLQSGGSFLNLPAWAPDLICLAGDITLLLHDVEVQHQLAITATGSVSWHASDTWRLVTFDPGGRNVTVNPALLECPITSDSFDITYSCSVLYMDRHHVDLSVNGLVKLALDSMACDAMDNAWGCSWDAAIDQVCASIGDPMLEVGCQVLIDALVIPEPCVDTTGMNLAGSGHMTGAGQMAGDWAGTINWSDFTGTFTGTRP